MAGGLSGSGCVMCVGGWWLSEWVGGWVDGVVTARSMSHTWAYRSTTHNARHLQDEMGHAEVAGPALESSGSRSVVPSSSSTECSTPRTSHSESFRAFAEATTNGSERFSPEVIEESTNSLLDSGDSGGAFSRHANSSSPAFCPRSVRAQVRLKRLKRRYFTFKIRDVNSSFPRSSRNNPNCTAQPQPPEARRRQSPSACRAPSTPHLPRVSSLRDCRQKEAYSNPLSEPQPQLPTRRWDKGAPSSFI